MTLKSRLLTICLPLLFFSACNGGDANNSTNPISPGHQTVQSGGKDPTTQCDGLRKLGRHEAMQSLGIDKLEEGSDQILSQLSLQDYQEIEANAQSDTAAAQKTINQIISTATQSAQLNWSQLQLGAETHRKLLLGTAEDLDQQGDFSLGSTTAVEENMLRVGSVDNVYLVLEASSGDLPSTYDIRIQMVSSESSSGQVETETISMSEYVERNILPAMCADAGTDLDHSNFDTIPVNVSHPSPSVAPQSH